jgi:hypothetical protein
MENSEGMIEPSVESTWLDHVRHRKLANTPQPLKDGRLNDIRFVARQPNEAMYRITYSSLFAHGSKHFVASSF